MKNIFLIGFDGPNRSGKGTQTSILKSKLEDQGYPTLIVRGDGSRPGAGTHLGDPTSQWRKDMNLILKGKESTPQLWEAAAVRLARELVVFKKRVLPNLIKENNAKLGFVLLDRTLISRTMIPTQYDLGYIDYPKNSGIDIQDICPDLIFNILVPKNVLHSRLDQNDLKYEFRKKLIQEKSQEYYDASRRLGKDIQEKVIAINGAKPIGTVSKIIQHYLYNHIKKTTGNDLFFLLK